MSTRDQILSLTHCGLDVFAYYVGENVRKKMFCNPFRGDTSPSCQVKVITKKGMEIYYMIDYGDSSWCGDCFTIAARVCRLNVVSDFPKLLRTIIKDLNLPISSDESSPFHDIIQPLSRHLSVRPEPVKFCGVYQDFHPWEMKYWKRYGIDAAILEKYNVKSVRRCTFTRPGKNSYTLAGTYLEPMYGYLFNKGKGIKVYRPFSKPRFLYAGSLPTPYVFGWEQLKYFPSNDFGLLVGGEKDVMSLAARGFPAIALNSESARVPLKIMDDLVLRYKHILFAYDCDATGVRESKARVAEFASRYPVGRVDLPLIGSKSEKDVSDFFSMGYTAGDYRHLVFLALSGIN